MTSKTARELCGRFAELQSAKSAHERTMREISEHIRQVRLEFRSIYDGTQDPAQINPYITNSTAAIALDNFVGGIFGYLSNEANEWMGVKSYDDDLNEFHAAKTWLGTVSRRILKSYGPAMCAFYAQVPELYADTAGLGTGCFLSEWIPGQRQIFDRAFSPFDVYLDVDQYYNVDTVYRPFWWSKRQMAQKWGVEKLPEAVQKASDTARFMILHVVTANDTYSTASFGKTGFPYTDIYIEYQTATELQRGGRYDFYQAPRWSGGGTYGFGLGHRGLADFKTLNAFDRGMLEQAEWQNHPPPLMPDRNAASTVRPVPRKPIYGGMSMSGRKLVDFLVPNGNLSITHEMMVRREEQVRDGFFFSLMQLVGRTGMTATETMARDEQKMRLLGPHLARIQREFLSPSVAQRFQLLWRAGQLPPPPRELQGHDLRIDYVSPMAAAQKSASAAGTLRVIDATVALMQVNPEAADNLNADEALRVLQDGFSAPASVINAPERVAQIRDERRALAQASQALQMGQQGADIAQKLAIAVPRNDGMKAA